MTELELVQPLDVVEPCAAAKAQLQDHGSGRYMHLSKLKNQKGHCTWCEKWLTGRQQRWCSEKCAQSALWYCQPQAPASKIHRLIFTQNCACAGCGQSFEEEIRDMIRKRHHQWNGVDTMFTKEVPEKISLYYLGYGTGDQWQTDHIVPVHQGGKGIDPANLQVLCVECHKTKTIEERR